jgi:hypothetical protein
MYAKRARNTTCKITKLINAALKKALLEIGPRGRGFLDARG